MRIGRSQLVNAVRGEDYCFFAVADEAFKTTGMPHEYLGGETQKEGLTGKPSSFDRLRTQGSECFVHQHSSSTASPQSSTHMRGGASWGGGHDRH